MKSRDDIGRTGIGRGARVRRRSGLLVSVAAAAVFGWTLAAQALPEDPVVAATSGSGPGATFNTGPSSLTVTQTDQRVVIDWSSFNIASGEIVTFDQPSATAIAFNRVAPDSFTTISGALNANGSVWLFSPAGILFGNGAVVSAGSFLASTGFLGDGSIDSALYGNSLVVDPQPDPNGQTITVEAGASITATDGFVALHSLTISQGGDVTASDAVVYDADEGLSLTIDDSGSGVTLYDQNGFAVVDRQSTINHTGTTHAGTWFEADTWNNQSMGPGFGSVMNLQGHITADGMKPDSSDSVRLFSDTGGPGGAGYSVLNGAGGEITGNGRLVATGGTVRTGDWATSVPNGAEGVSLQAGAGGIDIAGHMTLADGFVNGATPGAVSVEGSIVAGGSIILNGDSITLGPQALIQASLVSPSGINLTAAGDFSAAATSVVMSGPDLQTPTGSVGISAGSLTRGGNLTAGRVSGGYMYVHAYSFNGVGGDLTLNGDLSGGVVLAYNNDIFHFGTGAVHVNANVTGDTVADVESIGSGGLTIGPNRVIHSNQTVFVWSGGGDLLISNGARIETNGSLIFVVSDGRLILSPTAVIQSFGASATADTFPVLPPGAELRRTGGINLMASEIDLQGSVVAGPANGRDDVYIEVRPQATAAVIGGADGVGGFHLSDAEFQHITGRRVVILGGPGGGQDVASDLDLQTLTLDPSRISSLWLGTDDNHIITVSGVVSALAGAPVDVHLGFTRQTWDGEDRGIRNTLPAGDYDPYTPGGIIVTGSLGTAGGPLGAVTLAGEHGIGLGSQAFIDAILADETLDAVKASAAHPNPEPGHIFVNARSLQLFSLGGRIVQQNTAPGGAGASGLIIGAPTAQTPLVVTPAFFGLEGADGLGSTPGIDTPSKVELFGTFTSSNGASQGGVAAATAPNLTDTFITDAGDYHFNGCLFGGGSCQSAAAPPRIEIPVIDISPTTNLYAAETVAAGADSPGDKRSGFAASIFPVAGAGPTDRPFGDTSPVTGAGNRDLWTASQDDDDDDDRDKPDDKPRPRKGQ